MVFTFRIPFPVRKILRYEWGPILGTDFLVGSKPMEFEVKIWIFYGTYCSKLFRMVVQLTLGIFYWELIRRELLWLSAIYANRITFDFVLT